MPGATAPGAKALGPHMSELNLILLGPPGSGKGTQGEELQEDLRLPYYATGDILRAAVKEGTEVGKQAKEYMDKGELVPDDVIIGVISERVQRHESADGFILDVNLLAALDANADLSDGVVLDASAQAAIANAVAGGKTVNFGQAPDAFAKDAVVSTALGTVGRSLTAISRRPRAVQHAFSSGTLEHARAHERRPACRRRQPREETVSVLSVRDAEGADASELLAEIPVGTSRVSSRSRPTTRVRTSPTPWTARIR